MDCCCEIPDENTHKGTRSFAYFAYHAVAQSWSLARTTLEWAVEPCIHPFSASSPPSTRVRLDYELYKLSRLFNPDTICCTCFVYIRSHKHPHWCNPLWCVPHDIHLPSKPSSFNFSQLDSAENEPFQPSTTLKFPLVATCFSSIPATHHLLLSNSTAPPCPL